MGKSYQLFWITVIVVATILGFQNCGEVKIAPNNASSYTITSVGGEFCSLATVADDVYVNFIFVVDMSGSNVRRLTGSQFIADGASDPAGVRFQMIRDFINSDCIKNKDRARFAVYGFSADVMPTPRSSVCNFNRLVDVAQVDEQIAGLESIQSSEPRPPSQTVQSMGSTVYEKSFDCAKDIVQSHIGSLTLETKKNHSYQVMFLSDGAPTDSSGNPSSNFSPIYTAVESLQTLAATGGGAIVQPVLYGANLLTPAERERAENVMREIAKRGDSLESAVTDPTQINFCELFTAGRRTPFIVTSFGVINLTAKMKSGRLLPDSDMDGILDSEEIPRGFNPSYPRSLVDGNQVLDGVCRFNANQCMPHTCGSPNKMGLTDCETVELSLTDGLDTDIDGIPDYVEFLKGLHPGIDDANVDVDGDGMINGKEISVGRDPSYSDSGIDTSMLISVQRRLSSEPTSTCPAHQERWVFSVANIPLVPTLASMAAAGDPVTPTLSWMSHGPGENVILVYYAVQEQNAIETVPATIYGKYFKMKEGQAIELTQFEKLGVVNGVFEPQN